MNIDNTPMIAVIRDGDEISYACLIQVGAGYQWRGDCGTPLFADPDSGEAPTSGSMSQCLDQLERDVAESTDGQGLVCFFMRFLR